MTSQEEAEGNVATDLQAADRVLEFYLNRYNLSLPETDAGVIDLTVRIAEMIQRERHRIEDA
jgi:hypothetical protein